MIMNRVNGLCWESKNKLNNFINILKWKNKYENNGNKYENNGVIFFFTGWKVFNSYVCFFNLNESFWNWNRFGIELVKEFNY